MISLKKRQSGFTIVELLIVIVVIGILAAIVITTYSGIQAKARNAKRETDIQSLQTQVEAFYSQNGYYPNAYDLNSWAFIAANMKSLATSAEQDPSSTCTLPSATNATGNCISSAAPAAKSYSYQVTPSTCEGAGNDVNCTGYTLTATLESGAGTYVKTNLD